MYGNYNKAKVQVYVTTTKQSSKLVLLFAKVQVR
jgi:hypothetical protein